MNQSNNIERVEPVEQESTSTYTHEDHINALERKITELEKQLEQMKVHQDIQTIKLHRHKKVINCLLDT